MCNTWLGVKVMLVGENNQNPTHDFQIRVNTKSCSYLPPFSPVISMSNNALPPNSFHQPPFGWAYVVENCTDQNVNPTFLSVFCAHYRPILHSFATKHNPADRRRDQNRLPMQSHQRPKNRTYKHVDAKHRF